MSQKTIPQLGDELLTSWNHIGRKLIAMAQDFPEGKYDFKPAPKSRPFAAQLLHVAGTNYLFHQRALWEKNGARR